MPPLFPTNGDEVFAIANSPRTREITIGGETFPLGELTPEWTAELKAMGLRIVDHARAGTAPSGEDSNPGRILYALLACGSPHRTREEWASVWKQVRLEHIQIASREFMRQICAAALAPAASTGRA